MNVLEIGRSFQNDIRIFIFQDQVVIIDQEPNIIPVCFPDKLKTLGGGIYKIAFTIGYRLNCNDNALFLNKRIKNPEQFHQL